MVHVEHSTPRMKDVLPVLESELITPIDTLSRDLTQLLDTGIALAANAGALSGLGYSFRTGELFDMQLVPPPTRSGKSSAAQTTFTVPYTFGPSTGEHITKFADTETDMQPLAVRIDNGTSSFDVWTTQANAIGEGYTGLTCSDDRYNHVEIIFNPDGSICWIKLNQDHGTPSDPNVLIEKQVVLTVDQGQITAISHAQVVNITNPIKPAAQSIYDRASSLDTLRKSEGYQTGADTLDRLVLRQSIGAFSKHLGFTISDDQVDELVDKISYSMKPQDIITALMEMAGRGDETAALLDYVIEGVSEDQEGTGVLSKITWDEQSEANIQTKATGKAKKLGKKWRKKIKRASNDTVEHAQIIINDLEPYLPNLQALLEAARSGRIEYRNDDI